MMFGLFICAQALAIDGDTLKCAFLNDGRAVNVRLAGIDAPELPGHCRRGRDCAPGDPYVSKRVLQILADAGTVECEQVDANPSRRGFQDLDPWRRPVARCAVDGKDLGDALLSMKLARKWP